MKRNICNILNNIVLVLLFIIVTSCIRQFHNETKRIENSKVLETTYYDLNDKTSSLLCGEAIDIETKEKLAYITVEIKRPLITYSTSGDSSSFFQFKNKIPGTYKVQFKYIGYKPLIIDSINIENGKAINVRVGLKRQKIFLIE